MLHYKIDKNLIYHCKKREGSCVKTPFFSSRVPLASESPFFNYYKIRDQIIAPNARLNIYLGNLYEVLFSYLHRTLIERAARNPCLKYKKLAVMEKPCPIRLALAP